jgi:hypothetical protein
LRVFTGRLRLLNRLPAIYGLREYVDAAGLIPYGATAKTLGADIPPTLIAARTHDVFE